MHKQIHYIMNMLKQQHAWSQLTATLALSILIICCTLLGTFTTYTIYIDQQPVGTVGSRTAWTMGLAQAQQELEQQTGLAIAGVINDIQLKQTYTRHREDLSANQLSSLIQKKIGWYISGVQLTIEDNGSQFYLTNAEEGEELLNALAAAAITQQEQEAMVTAVDFAEQISLVPAEVPLSELSSASDVLTRIQDKQLLNPVVTKEVTIEEPIAYTTQYQPSDDLLRGETVTLAAGQEGSKLVTYTVKEQNGTALAKAVVDEVVIQQPVDAVIQQGSASLSLASRSATGILSWPKIGSINSPYGIRNDRLHAGLDISAQIGDNVKAAAGGTVEISTYYSDYGNCIVIDHGNGLKTRYAHLSVCNASAGDEVERGEIIGLAGNTGRSTGPHLHFEVILNGSTVDPLDYLRS